MTLKQTLQMQPWSGLIALALFFGPILPMAVWFGPQVAVGALLYLGYLFLFGEVHVKWVPLRDRLKAGWLQTIVEEKP